MSLDDVLKITSICFYIVFTCWVSWNVFRVWTSEKRYERTLRKLSEDCHKLGLKEFEKKDKEKQ